MKYVVWNKDMDYRRGRGDNLRFEGGRLELDCVDSEVPGAFLSRTIDSGEPETIWHRMVVNAEVGENMALYFYLYVTDSEPEVRRIEATWTSGTCLVREHMAQMGHLEKRMVRNPEDVLLHEVKGRYLWLGILLWGNGAAGPVIENIQIYFPKETWTRYLPEIYQGKGNEFLERFLGIFQTLYQDMEQKIRTDAAYLDIGTAEGELLQWLTGWIHVENSHLWREKQLKQYLSNGAALFAVRGTPYALIRMVEIFTGERPFLVEAKEGDDPHRFQLMLREEAIGDVAAYRAVERIIREGKPADMEVVLVPLKPYLFLDRHTYLGVNSILNYYGQAVLGEECALEFVMLGGNDG